MADLGQCGIDMRARGRRTGQVGQALQKALFNAFESCLNFARQGLHKGHLGLIQCVRICAGGFAFTRHFELAVLKQIVLLHMAVQHEAHCERKRQSGGHDLAELRIVIQALHGKDGPGHGERRNNQKVQKHRRAKKDDGCGCAGTDHQEHFGLRPDQAGRQADGEQVYGPNSAGDALIPETGADEVSMNGRWGGGVRIGAPPSINLVF